MKLPQTRAKASVDLSRFQHYFPVTAWLIKNLWFLLPIFGFIAGILSIFSIHYGLSVLCIWMGLLCFWVDRKHLNFCLFTPLQPLATICIMSLGFGISMVVYDGANDYHYGFMCMQLAGIFGFPFFIVGYILLTKRVSGFVFPRGISSAGNEYLMKALVFVGWILMAHELAKVVAGVVSGTIDRGVAGDFQIDTPFGWWSIFSIFLRIPTLGYLLVPLIWKESKSVGKIAVSVVVFVCLFLHFVAASRGAFFTPIFIMVVALYMFFEFKSIKYEVVILTGLIGIVPLITVMSYYRTSEEFRQTDIRDIWQKVSTITYGIENKKHREESEGRRYAEAGGSFIGVSDSLIYEMTPDVIPHGGSERLGDIVWIFIPYILTSEADRPVLHDGRMISSSYSGIYHARSSIGISYPADLYRRWGWAAIPFGLFIYGVFYGLVFKVLYEFYLMKNAVLGFLFCGLAFHFFVAWFFGTILSTAWFWFYDIPKHLILLLCIYILVLLVFGTRKVPGALSLMNKSMRA